MIQKIIRQTVSSVLVAATLSACVSIDSKDDNITSLEEIAANEEVANYLKAHEGRGVLADDTKPTPPIDALAGFRYPDDLALDLVLSEPDIHQPVFMNFDHRGRLWVVQYNQYPFPEGLKITSIDNHLRAEFDKVPAPPPDGVKGADKITFFEDTDGDGTYEKSTDAITGLNIATSVALGRGRIWVLSPPYLLAYPDADGDGLPNGSPAVHLRGFGLEDTHAVANSLHWGPDGWLYGAQGSTTTANISSSASKNVAFEGQAIWRYHPVSEVFEIFAEGGGNNAFHVEIDAKGRIYSGSNGTDRGPYYKQGGYYVKSWGKHGPLTNPYAFGYLPNMVLQGEKKRFTHALVKYEGASLPARYHRAMLAINPLQNYLQLSRFKSVGSTFSVVDEERIVETDDHWFRPVNLKVGPDGAVYLADWYDSRLSHVDPRDTWHRASGRIYRLRSKHAEESRAPFDLSKYSSGQLIELLSHPNKWFRQQALRQFADRNDSSVVPQLLILLNAKGDTSALEALWAIHLSGGFNDATAITALHHHDPFVRMWAVRLLGDANKVSKRLSHELVQLAAREPHPEVRSQIASSARRLPAADAMSIIKSLLTGHDDGNDPDIPLLIWWAIEAKSESDQRAVLSLFEDPEMWKVGIVQTTILKRIMQRYTMAGGQTNFAACTRLLQLAPSTKDGGTLISGLQEGLRGKDIRALPADLVEALKPYHEEFAGGSLALALRQEQPEAVKQALSIIADRNAETGERLIYIRIMGETRQRTSVPVLLKIIEGSEPSGAIRHAALQALQHFDEAEIGRRVAEAYPNRLRADADVRSAALSLLASRVQWAQQLITHVDLKKQTRKEKEDAPEEIARRNFIDKDDVPTQIVRQLKLLHDPAIDEAVERLWPEVRLATSAEKSERITKVSKLLKEGRGDVSAGRRLFEKTCGACHRLFNTGGDIGPDLTGYDRRNVNDLVMNTVDPNADIREGYVNYHVITTDGRTLAGTITARSSEAITLQPLGGEAIMLTTGQIREMKAQSTSLMPERLLDHLTDQQIRDIFAYIMKDNE
jgi:putative membrane-bound dehydrogenase-like protein